MEKETVYVIVEMGCVMEVRSNANIEVVVLDRDTLEEEVLENVEKRIEEIQDLPEIEIH